MRKTVQIKWSLKKVCILGIDRRIKLHFTHDENEYAVISVGTIDQFDDLTLEERLHLRRCKAVCLMCFDKSLYNRLKEGEIYSLTGKVSFGYGSTYFTLDKAFFVDGTPVNPGETNDSDEAYIV